MGYVFILYYILYYSLIILSHITVILFVASHIIIINKRLFFIDAQTLDATARLTNIQFTADLQNSSSQAYKNLTESITEEVHVL